MDPITLGLAAVSAYSGLKSAGAAKKASKSQADIAKKQLALYNQTLPSYQDSINALRQNAGFAPLNYNATQTTQVPADGVLGRAGVMRDVTTNNPTPITQGSATGPGANLYGNVTNQQLGPYGMNPTDRLRLLGAEENINKGLLSRQNQLSFGLGRRGLTGSNLDVAARAQLLNQANEQRGTFARNLAINAGHEQEQRLQLLLNALNPGLGSGPAASSAYGNIAANAGNAAAGIGQSLGGAAQNVAYMNALKQGQPQAQDYTAGQAGLAYPELTQLQAPNMQLPSPNYGPQLSTPGVSYGNSQGFTPNPNYGPAPVSSFNPQLKQPSMKYQQHQPFSEFGAP